VDTTEHCGRCINNSPEDNNYYWEECGNYPCTQEYPCPQRCYTPPRRNCGTVCPPILLPPPITTTSTPPPRVNCPAIQCPPPPPLYCPAPPPVKCPPVVCPTKPTVCPTPPKKPVKCPTRGPITFPPLICPSPPPVYCPTQAPKQCPPLYCPAPPPQWCPPISCPGPPIIKCPAPPPFQCPPVNCPITYPKECEYGHNVTDYCPPIELPFIHCPAPPPVECPAPPAITCPAVRCPLPQTNLPPLVCPPPVQCRRPAPRPCPQIINCPINCPQCPRNNCYQGDDPNVVEGSKVNSSLVVIDPAKVTGKIGDKIVLNCSSSSTAMDKIIWKMNNHTSLPKHVGLSRDGTQLIIKSLEERDQGIYFCVGLNNQTQSWARAEIILENDNNEPNNTLTYQTMRSSPGSSISIQCSFPHGKWSRKEGGGSLPVNSKIEENVINGGASLTLTSVGEGDAGIYLCSSEQSWDRIEINLIINEVRTFK
jgi:hypothetical protein